MKIITSFPESLSLFIAEAHASCKKTPLLVRGKDGVERYELFSTPSEMAENHREFYADFVESYPWLGNITPLGLADPGFFLCFDAGTGTVGIFPLDGRDRRDWEYLFSVDEMVLTKRAA